MRQSVNKLGVFSLSLLALPLVACAAADGSQSTPRAMHSDTAPQAFPANSHAQTFDYEYTMKPVTIDGHTIIAKHLTDGSRWALLDGSWYDIDFSPHVVPIIAGRELTPPDRAPLSKKDPESKAHRQYEIDLDYYNASVALRAL